MCAVVTAAVHKMLVHVEIFSRSAHFGWQHSAEEDSADDILVKHGKPTSRWLMYGRVANV